MINSFCIKNNQDFILDYLLNQLQQTNLTGIYLSKNKFKNYNNIIIHSTGKCSFDDFVFHVSSCLANTVLAICESQILKRIIYSNYFYFSDIEKKQILNEVVILLNTYPKDILIRRKIIFSAFKKYLKENCILNLDGFLTFRLNEYRQELDDAIDSAVDKFVIEKEYNEFISLLKLYINSKESGASELHLIYNEQEAILLDSNHQKINTYDHIFNAKYLSDISFSSNDYALNTILNIAPQKLYIHLFKNNEDEFITTLKLIFEDRIQMCHGCPICDIYRNCHHLVSCRNDSKTHPYVKR